MSTSNVVPLRPSPLSPAELLSSGVLDGAASVVMVVGDREGRMVAFWSCMTRADLCMAARVLDRAIDGVMTEPAP